MPKLSEFLFGKKPKVKQAKTLDASQQQLLDLINQGITSGEGPLKDLFGVFNEQAFDTGVSQPALKNFKENILPLLQEKFISGNQVGGSGQREAFGKAGTDLQSQLAQLMYQAQQQQQQNRLSGINTALGTKTFENLYKPGNEGLFQGVSKAFAQGLGTAAVGGASGGLVGGAPTSTGSNFNTGTAGNAAKAAAFQVG